MKKKSPPIKKKTAFDRKATLKRVRTIADNARTLVTYDGHASPPDWRPFVAELADELAHVIEALS